MNFLKRFVEKYPLIKNKYLITTLVFLGWILFFDKNNLVSQFEERQKLFELKKEKRYYQDEIRSTREQLDELMTDNVSLEKFAREKYLMKKENEDLFLVVHQQDTTRN